MCARPPFFDPNQANEQPITHGIREDSRLMQAASGETTLNAEIHPLGPHHLPGFIIGPGETDYLMIGVGIFLILAVLGVGNLYLQLHSLPERLAHKSKKLQLEVVAVLCLLSLFTHNHLYWVIGLFLALVDLPDFITPLRRIAGSVDRLAGVPPEPAESDVPAAGAAHGVADEGADTVRTARSEVQAHV
jgi:hypothetical protein